MKHCCTPTQEEELVSLSTYQYISELTEFSNRRLHGCAWGNVMSIFSELMTSRGSWHVTGHKGTGG